MKKFFWLLLFFVMAPSMSFAQEEELFDFVWDRVENDSAIQNDVNRKLVLDEDSMPSGRFKQPIKFTKSELNKIKDPRVRDVYWYALNDTTDSQRYLKAHYAFNRARDNWAVELGGGVQSVFTNFNDPYNKASENFSIGPQVDLTFKKDLHPYWAMQIRGQYSRYSKYLFYNHESTFIDNWEERENIDADNYWNQHVNYSTFALKFDLMLNILNIWAGRELLYNPYDWYVFAGSGAAFSYRNNRTDNESWRDGSCLVPFWEFGTKLYANFTQRWSMYLSLESSWQGDDMEGYSEQNSTFKCQALLGASYKFSRVIHFNRLGYDDSALRQRLNEAYEEGDRLSNYIQNAKKDTIVNLPADLITAAFFQIDRVELAHTYVLNLGFYADLIKTHPQQKFLVRGFADLEVGTVKRNEWLCNKRAQVVADVLVKTYGVDENQLIIGGGDLDIELPFLREDGHHRFNRCTIVCPITKDYQIIQETEFDDNAELMDGRIKSSIKKNY